MTDVFFQTFKLVVGDSKQNDIMELWKFNLKIGEDVFNQMGWNNLILALTIILRRMAYLIFIISKLK